MKNLDVRIVRLPPMRVASAYGFGPSPEAMAFQKMIAFLQAKGILGDDLHSFGFDNPHPSPGSPNYGYEVWVQVGEEVTPEGDIRIQEFCGGLYAVTRFEGLEQIGRVWQELVKWRERSAYGEAHYQCLEHLLNPLESDPAKYVFDLYLPVME